MGQAKETGRSFDRVGAVLTPYPRIRDTDSRLGVLHRDSHVKRHPAAPNFSNPGGIRVTAHLAIYLFPGQLLFT